MFTYTKEERDEEVLYRISLVKDLSEVEPSDIVKPLESILSDVARYQAREERFLRRIKRYSRVSPTLANLRFKPPPKKKYYIETDDETAGIILMEALHNYERYVEEGPLVLRTAAGMTIGTVASVVLGVTGVPQIYALGPFLPCMLSGFVAGLLYIREISRRARAAEAVEVRIRK